MLLSILPFVRARPVDNLVSTSCIMHPGIYLAIPTHIIGVRNGPHLGIFICHTAGHPARVVYSATPTHIIGVRNGPFTSWDFAHLPYCWPSCACCRKPCVSLIIRELGDTLLMHLGIYTSWDHWLCTPCALAHVVLLAWRLCSTRKEAWGVPPGPNLASQTHQCSPCTHCSFCWDFVNVRFEA